MSKSLSVCLALGTLASSASCIDWDALRMPDNTMVDQDAGADTGMNGDGFDPVNLVKPVVEWTFADLFNGVVADKASPAPDLPLLLNRDGASDPIIEDGALWLGSDLLVSRPTAAKDLGDAIVAAGGGMTFEIWLRGTIAQDRSFLLGFQSGGFALLVRDRALWIELRTRVGLIDVRLPALSLMGEWHHLAFTYRPGLSLLTGYFDGVSVVLAGDEVADPNSQLVFVAEGEATTPFTVTNGEIEDLRLGSAAVFTRELTADEIKRRHSLGLSRL